MWQETKISSILKDGGWHGTCTISKFIESDNWMTESNTELLWDFIERNVVELYFL